MNDNSFLSIPIPTLSKKNILEKIKKYVKKPDGFFHIVSLNPEIIIIANENNKFKKIVKSAQMRIIDGTGIILACRLLGIKYGERFAGVDLMKEMLALAGKLCLRVVLIGGKNNLANSIANCYQKKYPQAEFYGLEGIKKIKDPQKEEEDKIFYIVSHFKPHLVFVAFGSPFQELWIDRYKDKFKNTMVMGVGGAFDFLAKKIPRAPKILRLLGLEWLFRLIIQPWRWRRQLRLVKFIFLVLRSILEKDGSFKNGKNI